MSLLSHQKYSVGGFEMETSNFAHNSCPKLSESYRPMEGYGPWGCTKNIFFKKIRVFYYISPQMRCDLI